MRKNHTQGANGTKSVRQCENILIKFTKTIYDLNNISPRIYMTELSMIKSQIAIK